MFVSNFAYPIITSKIKELVSALEVNNIETRPLICGSISKQPFWIDKYGDTETPIADWLHNKGLYLPNNHQMTYKEIMLIIDVVNKILN